MVGVHDGDTITVLTADKERVRIRLEGIDAPELGQPFGKESKKVLSDLIFGKLVIVHDKGPDIYKRTLGRVICGPVDVNLEMVRQGFAWWFRRYSNELALITAENEAKQNQRGLWADKEPVPPWLWRKQSKTSKQ